MLCCLFAFPKRATKLLLFFRICKYFSILYMLCTIFAIFFFLCLSGLAGLSIHVHFAPSRRESWSPAFSHSIVRYSGIYAGIRNTARVSAGCVSLCMSVASKFYLDTAPLRFRAVRTAI